VCLALNIWIWSKLHSPGSFFSFFIVTIFFIYLILIVKRNPRNEDKQ
jgi:hypothetical protein